MRKIKDNPSYAKIRTELEELNSMRKASKVLSVMGIKSVFEVGDTLDSIPTMQKQFEEIASMPDRFNEAFSNNGWIAHESMNADLMSEAVTLAENGKFGQGNQLLH